MQVEENLDPFMQAYRDSLQQVYDSGLKQLNQQRLNDQTSIMSKANTRGMMFSNFPQRDKIQYDANTYNPALVNLRNSYQTGLDSLRTKGVDLANSIKKTQEAIADLEKYGLRNSSSSSSSGVSVDDIVSMVQQQLAGTSSS